MLCAVEDVEGVFLVSTVAAEELAKLVEVEVVVICSIVRMFLVTASCQTLFDPFQFSYLCVKN